MRFIFVALFVVLAGVQVFESGCTTTKTIVVTPTIEETPTLSPEQQAYLESVATQAARPSDTPIPTYTPVPPTAIPSPASPTPAAPAPPPPAPPTAIPPAPAHDAVDLAYKQQLMDNCMVTIRFRPQCVCITDTLIGLADRAGLTYRLTYDAWIEFSSGRLGVEEAKEWADTVGLTPCFDY